jgi:hypothetical protein
MTLMTQQALAGQAENAVHLLSSGLACPTKIISSGNGEGFHSIYRFTGNQKTFSVIEDTVSYSRREKRQALTVQHSADFADLEAVTGPGSSLKIVCHDGSDCIHEVVNEGGRRTTENVTRIDFELCDTDTALNVVTAIRTLIVGNR